MKLLRHANYGTQKIYSVIDEAAALSIVDPLESKIEGVLLFDFSEKIGTQFGQRQSDQKTIFLNKQIISRLLKAPLIFTSKIFSKLTSKMFLTCGLL